MECGGEESTGTRTKKIRPWLSSNAGALHAPPGGAGGRRHRLFLMT